MKWFGLLVISMLLLMGCTSNDNTKQEEELSFLDVKVEVSPKKVLVGEVVTINAIVTYGDETVEDANEVKFQIWEKGNEDEEEYLEGEHSQDGVYSVTKTFNYEGFYYIVAHVTARDMHTMPKKELIVGDPIVLEDEETESDTVEETHHHDKDESGENAH